MCPEGVILSPVQFAHMDWVDSKSNQKNPINHNSDSLGICDEVSGQHLEFNIQFPDILRNFMLSIRN